MAAFIALESVGIPLPAEAALIAAGFFAARTHGIEISSLITAGIAAAIFGEIVGFWIGRRFGHQLLMRYGPRLGVTAVVLGLAAALIILAAPLLILRYERRILAKVEQHWEKAGPRKPAPLAC